MMVKAPPLKKDDNNETEEPEEFIKDQKLPIGVLLQVATLLVALIAVGGLFRWAGAADAILKNHESRLVAIEGGGSAALQKHEALDDQRVKDLDSRVCKTEGSLNSIQIILADVKSKGDVLLIKLDALADELKSRRNREKTGGTNGQ